MMPCHDPAPSASETATLPDLVYYGPLNQAEGMKYGIEHFRRLRLHTMGTLVWQLNDCWPVHSWAWLDHRLRPKAAWYYAKRFYAPLLVNLARQEQHLSVHVVNDLLTPVDGSLVVRALASQGAVLWQAEQPVRVEGGASQLALAADLPTEVMQAAPYVILHARFADVDNTLLLVEPKAMRLGVPQ